MLGVVTLLAVTRMLSGFCLAGVDAEGRWIRPVKRFGTLTLADVSYRDRTLMRPFDRVQLEIEAGRPDPPHVEDRVCELLRPRPELVGQLAGAERSDLVRRLAEADAAPLLRGERSLTLVDASDASATFALDAYSGKYEARLSLPRLGARPLACTDLRWRALGRGLLPATGGSRELASEALHDLLGTRELYAAIGLGRRLDGAARPLVVGVHAPLDYPAVVDPSDP